eukprot:CAMPEP_0195535362 /NCGR_PEP_ID=MMETSP0794_2-20130614/44134_1 /TAXON_ID=515487 /ORGANISM="Stephanopyxis turris, Strain CCMP 815" /LENGTH=339 /DNA_ID=CAMNT_0040668485 /DNA_START=131 /DNA_END=1150 /DNA_ORIENTATION=-
MAESMNAGGSNSYFKNPSRAQSMMDILEKEFGVSDAKLTRAIAALGEAVAECAHLLSNAFHVSKAGSQNLSGDDQLQLDIDCDNACFSSIRQSNIYSIAASEETPVETSINEEEGVFSCAFDPLDGSSIIDANFAIGGIFGIWPGKGIIGKTGRDQICSAISVYGPRTTFLVGLTPKARRGSSESEGVVLECTLANDKSNWVLSSNSIQLQEFGKIFAPGNLRASNDNPKYNSLIQYWINNRYTLRYTGGMVPDVYHIFAKRKGVFANVSSEKAKAKLRLVYEVNPVGLLVELAGGKAIVEGEDKCVLDLKMEDLDQRSGVCFGSRGEVEKYIDFMFKD